MLSVYLKGFSPPAEKYIITEIHTEEAQNSEDGAIRVQVAGVMRQWEKSGASGVVIQINSLLKGMNDYNGLAMSVVSEIRRRVLLRCMPVNVVIVADREEAYSSFKDMAERDMVVCLGDSITYGFPHGPRYSWVHIAGESLGLTMINRGQNGDTTAGMLGRFNSQVIPHNPSHVVIMGGINDVLMEVDTQSIKDNITKIMFKALSNGICPIIGITTPIIGEIMGWYGSQAVSALEDLQQWLRTFTREKDIPVIDFCSSLSGDEGRAIEDLFVDGGHPSREGYIRMADAAGAVLGIIGK